METITTAQKIKRMEAELAELKKQQSEEIKAAERIENEKRKRELDKIKEQIEVFNTKYGTEYMITTKSALVLAHYLGW